MPSLGHVCLGALAATLYWTLVGHPLARQLMSGRLAWAIAPALGWAAQSAAAFPLFLLVGFSFTSAFLVCAATLGVSLLALAAQPKKASAPCAIPLWVFGGAAIVALAPAAVLFPKTTADGIALAIPIFDHAKVAIIDQITRGGLPPANPFFGPVGEPSPLSYYYLWHFSAAQLSLLSGITAWEADAALTWFTAFSALMLIAALAVWFSRRSSSAGWALLFSVSGSIRPFLALAFGGEALNALVLPTRGFAGWFYQASWAPQHIAAASSTVLAIFVIGQAAGRRELAGPAFLLLSALVLLAVAACESSAWIGGVAFPPAAALAGATVLIALAPAQRIAFLAWAGAGAVAALVLGALFLHEQFLAVGLRAPGVPIAFTPYQVLGPGFPEPLRRLVDLPAYWLVLLVIEAPAIYIAGALGMWCVFKRSENAGRKLVGVLFAELAAVGLLVSWLFASTIAENNDLGWRSVLPSFVVLIIFAAAALPQWLAKPARLTSSVAIGLLVLALPASIRNIRDDARPRPSASGRVFAETPALWAAVRRHAAGNERIANNPLFMADMTNWPVNISWALMANRASCFAGREFALAFVAIPHARRIELERQFERVFAGRPEGLDLGDLANRYDCRLVVVTAEDGAWKADPFASSALFQLVEANDKWRLYRRTAQ
jgi:hypothetical protein